MTIQDEAIARLDDVVGRNPIEFPYGIFTRDDYAGGSGNFFWYKTENDLLKSIKHDLPGIMAEINDDFGAIEAGLVEIVNVASGMPKLGDDLLKKLDNYMSRNGIIRIDFLGSFEQLCQDKTKFAQGIRNEFRCNVIENADQLSLKELNSSINENETDDFSEYISSMEM